MGDLGKSSSDGVMGTEARPGYCKRKMEERDWDSSKDQPCQNFCCKGEQRNEMAAEWGKWNRLVVRCLFSTGEILACLYTDVNVPGETGPAMM